MKISNLRVTGQKRTDLRMNVQMPERILWKWLRNKQLGYKFRRQHGIGKYIVDFYCPELSLVVEIDGKIHDEEPVNQKDIQREHFLESLGYVVKRYTAKQVNENIDWLLDDLKRFCDRLVAEDGNLT